MSPNDGQNISVEDEEQMDLVLEDDIEEEVVEDIIVQTLQINRN